jgi:hypothetical protein
VIPPPMPVRIAATAPAAAFAVVRARVTFRDRFDGPPDVCLTPSSQTKPGRYRR